MSSSLPHRLDRTVLIRAPRETVFRFFTDTARWASWWGAGSAIDPRPGGAVLIRYPDGTEATGQVVEALAPERIVFTYGYTKGTPVPSGGSLVTIRLEAVDRTTRLHFTHEFDDAATRDLHVQGWRYQLSLFSNLVADEINANAEALVDAWFDVWAEPDAAVREQTLARLVSKDITFHDRYSNIEGLAELLPHIAAAQHFMPGVRMRRTGSISHCQGTVLADWLARTNDGPDQMRGTNVFTFGADGLIASVTGFAKGRP